MASSSSEDAFGAAAAALAKESETKRKAFRDSAASLTNDAFKQHLQVIRVKGKVRMAVEKQRLILIHCYIMLTSDRPLLMSRPTSFKPGILKLSSTSPSVNGLSRISRRTLLL